MAAHEQYKAVVGWGRRLIKGARSWSGFATPNVTFEAPKIYKT
jgi:hypothetical protein